MIEAALIILAVAALIGFGAWLGSASHRGDYERGVADANAEFRQAVDEIADTPRIPIEPRLFKSR